MYVNLYQFWVAKVWRQNLDYAKNLQAKYFTSENIPIYGIYCIIGNFHGVQFLWMVDLYHFMGLIFMDVYYALYN